MTTQYKEPQTEIKRLRQALEQAQRERQLADDLLGRIIPIGVSLTLEQDFDRMLDTILHEAMAFCHADAGTLYLRTEDDHLRPMIMRNDTLGLAMGGSSGVTIPLAPLPLYHPDTNEPNHDTVATHTALSGKTVNVPGENGESNVRGAGPEALKWKTDYQVQTYLSLPLKNTRGDVIGVLQLLNAQNPETGEIIPFGRDLQKLMETFSLLATAALQAYLREQSLKQEIEQLRFEIDEVKRRQQVQEIVETDFFQDLQARAKQLRRRSRARVAKRTGARGQSGGEQRSERQRTET
ncbi:MAG: GAF domain-containing protein [Chloroflexi bacterium]|nr:GAF domain-containing protein [Chloroflexota bacterium]